MSPYVNVCVSNYSFVFTETFIRAEAQPPSSVLVRIPPSEGFNVWLRLQVKNAVCTGVILRNMALYKEARQNLAELPSVFC